MSAARAIARVLDRVWFETHGDYRGQVEGRRAILVLRDGATTLVPLDELTAREVRSRLPMRAPVREARP